MWLRLSGAVARRGRCAMSYAQIAACAQGGCDLDTARQILRDLDRTYPHSVFFDGADAKGTRRLDQVLKAFAWVHPDIGCGSCSCVLFLPPPLASLARSLPHVHCTHDSYCQGLNLLVGMLLLVLEEEDAFWTLCALVHHRVPANYYTRDLEGLIIDQRVFRSRHFLVIVVLFSVYASPADTQASGGDESAAPRSRPRRAWH